MQGRRTSLVVLVAALAFGGCTTKVNWRPWGGRGCHVAGLPNVEMDLSPARARSDTSKPLRPGPRGHKWAAEGEREWKYIVLHHSATRNGNIEVFHQQHRDRGWDELGYHFVICNGRGGADGEVQVGPRWRKQKWGAHCGGTPDNEYNEHGIGICLVGDFTDAMPTAAQMKSLHELIRYLMRTCEIPAEGVIAHKEAPNTNTECCGRTFFAHLRSTIRPTLRTGYAAAK